VRGAFTLAVSLALTFSYAGVDALVPAGVPQRPFAVAVTWAALGVAGYLACAARTGRPPRAAWALPGGRWPVLLAAVALAAVTAAAVWPPAHRSHLDMVRITIVGVIGEEVIFRGLAWDAVQAAAGRAGRWPDARTLALTSVLFAVAHLQYDGFRLTWALGGQIGYALAAGVALGWARGKTGSLVPPILLHSAGNAILKLAALIL
jgi:membrane protease YdiL (CAAX protease family)